MFTFLPRTYRMEVEREYRKRLWTVAWSLFSVLMLSATVLALPSYVMMSEKKKDTMIAFKDAGTPAPETIDFESQVKDIEVKTALLKNALAQRQISTVLELIASRIAQPGISISGISFKRGGSQVPQSGVTISGTASTRDDLVAFSKILGNDAEFKNVSLPVSSLAKSKNIPFTLHLDSQF